MKIGLALGGGGARGLAHIGVLKTLEKHHIPINLISGTSIGAVIAGLYAIYGNSQKIEEIASNWINSEVYRKLNVDFLRKVEQGETVTWRRKIFDLARDFYILALTRKKESILKPEVVEEVINSLFPDIDISDCKVPLAIVACDLISLDEVVFTRGSLRKAVQASMSIPGIFPPIRIGDKLLVDGGAANIIPTQILRKMGADLVIASEINSVLPPVSAKDDLVGIKLASRANYITSKLLWEEKLKHADIVISPQVKTIHWANFKKGDFCIRKGEEATEEKIKQIQQLMRRKRWASLLKLFHVKHYVPR